ALADKFAPILARRVVVATPAKVSADLLAPLAPALAQVLSEVTCARLAVVHLGGPDPNGVAPRGQSVMMVPGEGLRTLGIAFPSSLFADRAPAGHWLHTGLVGGAADPEAVDLPDDTLISLVQRAHEQAFDLQGARALPVQFAAVIRWRDAIAQPRVGHRAAMQGLAGRVLRELPGVALAGSYMGSLGAEPAAQSGLAAVAALAEA
ncbi:MAG: FAD-dependent oxidoreductase, partial [Deltaproteobacteria bacterium]|nr:FAD-dependent oxidoreductase [Deltaproteobacteria bacterium]